MAKGILTKPPAANPAAAQQRKQARSDAKYSANHGGAARPAATANPDNDQSVPKDKYKGMNNTQNKVQNFINAGDTSASDIRSDQLNLANQDMSQPFNWSNMPTAPWAQGQDAQGMANDYTSKIMANYDTQNNPGVQQQRNDFEQQMANKGIPMGSDLYNKQKAAMEQNIGNARQNALADATSTSANYANTFNTMGTQNYQNSFLDQQNRQGGIDLLRAGAAGGLLSNNPATAMGQSNAVTNKGIIDQTAKYQTDHQKFAPKQAPIPDYQLNGFPDYASYAAAQDNSAINRYNQTVGQQQGPNPYYSAAGQFLGTAAGAAI